MGFRTVVVFNNDQASTWENDPELGKKIARDIHRWHKDISTPLEMIGGKVLECVHADTQTLAVLDGYSGEAVAHRMWYHNQTKAERNIALLKELAENMGYRLVKKSKGK